jgi:hypothetical protein
VIAYYRDSGHRDKIHLGWLLILIGVFFFHFFVGALREVVRRLTGDGLLAQSRPQAAPPTLRSRWPGSPLTRPSTQ